MKIQDQMSFKKIYGLLRKVIFFVNMKIQKKVLLICFIIILVAIDIWSIHSIVQAYKPRTEVKGVQAKAPLIIPADTLSLTPTPTPNKYTTTAPSIAPTKTPSSATNNTPNITNASSQTQSTDTTSANPSSNDKSINGNSASTDQISSSPSPTPQQAILTPTTQPVNNQDTSTVIRGNDPGVGNTVNVVNQPPVTPVPVGNTVEVHFCPVDQTCQ